MLKLSDLVTLHNARLMYYNDLLPSFFDSFLQTVSSAQSLTSFASNELISAPSEQTMVFHLTIILPTLMSFDLAPTGDLFMTHLLYF